MLPMLVVLRRQADNEKKAHGVATPTHRLEHALILSLNVEPENRHHDPINEAHPTWLNVELHRTYYQIHMRLHSKLSAMFWQYSDSTGQTNIT